MRCNILVLSLAIIYANASPIDVVPEDSQYALADDLLEARETLNIMKTSGKTDTDCRKLVKETTTEITTTVTTGQKIIDELPDGSHCMSQGQAAVKTATESKTKADKHLIVCTTAVTTAMNHKVDFGWRTYSSLTAGKCDSFYSSTAYITAKTTYKAAVSAKEKAIGAAGEASTALKNAISAASKAKHACLCKTKKDHAKAFKDRSASNAANAKAWVKAHQIECVLDHKTKCVVPKVPTVKMGKVTAAVKEASC